MGFFSELVDEVASAFDSDEDEEAIAAANVAEAKEQVAQKLVDEGVAISLRIHGRSSQPRRSNMRGLALKAKVRRI